MQPLRTAPLIDPARVFAVGHSNGGFMSYRLACELSDRIAAVGLQAGGLMIDECAPERPGSLLHIHTAELKVVEGRDHKWMDDSASTIIDFLLAQ